MDIGQTSGMGPWTLMLGGRFLPAAPHWSIAIAYGSIPSANGTAEFQQPTQHPTVHNDVGGEIHFAGSVYKVWAMERYS